MNRTAISVGDRVRSYDFADVPSLKDTCFVEGVVEAVGHVDQVGGVRSLHHIERRSRGGGVCSSTYQSGTARGTTPSTSGASACRMTTAGRA